MNNIATIIFTIFCTLLISSLGYSQSVDPPNAIMHVEGAGHSVIKASSSGYTNDSTEVKFTNVAASGFGTEFVIKSVNETGLSISSNSDIGANNTDRIIHFEPDGDVYLGDLKGGGTRPLFINDDGKIITGCPSKFASFTSDEINFSTTNTNWVAVGNVRSFHKDCAETNLKIRYTDRIFYDQDDLVSVQIMIRVDGQIPDYRSEGSTYDNNSTSSNKLNTWFSTESIYTNLGIGNHNIRVYIRTIGGPGTGTIDPGNFNSAIIVEESY